MYRRTMSIAILVFAVLLIPCVQATDYYVDAINGSDSNNGLTPGTAWKTITHAVNNVPAGTPTEPNVIHVASGIYDSNNETFPITFNNAYVKLVGAGAETTIVDGGGATTIFEINATGITIQGFNITNATNGTYAKVGGFTVTDNVFHDVSDGVYFYIEEDGLESDYSIDDVLIRDNIFDISENGVYIYIYLDYNGTGFNVDIGNIYILNNTFNMETTYGIDIDYIGVEDLNDGNISVGYINISENKFYYGNYGIYFFGEFDYLENTTVTVGDFIINDNTFVDQSNYAMYIDYYDADYWSGTTKGTFGNLIINDNNINSNYDYADAIYIDDYAYFEYFNDTASLTVGNLYVQNNYIDVGDDGIDVYYDYAYELENNSSITMGKVFIKENTIYAEYGIYLEYYDFGEDMYGNSTVTTDYVYIEDNEINTSDEAIYVYYDYVAYYMENNATLKMGDIYIQNNNISAEDDGIYLEYYDEDVGYEMYDNAYAKLPSYIIKGNTIDVADNGIELYTYENPYYIYGNAIFDFGGFFIDGNTFSCDYGIYIDYDDFCYENYDDSSTIIGDIIITNNEFYDLEDEAIYIYYDDIGYDLYDNSTLDVGDLRISNNVIDNASYGIDIKYYYVYSYYNSKVTMGNLDVIGNRISNIKNDGIYLKYYPYAEDYSEQTIGRGLIQNNTINGCGDAGVYIYMNIYSDPGAIVNLANPLINDNTNNTISNCAYGIYLESVGGEQVFASETIKKTKKIENIDISSQDYEKKEVKEHGGTKNKKVKDRNREVKNRMEKQPQAKEEVVNIQAVTNGGGYIPVTVTNNRITNNEHGIYIDGLSNNTIERNIIENNTLADTGIHITSGSNNNEIHENCFINNEPQAYDNGSNNNWDSNYWDPPPSADYTIQGSANSKDNDPLPHCPCFPTPTAKVPTLTPIGLVALIGLISAIAVVNMKRNK